MSADVKCKTINYVEPLDCPKFDPCINNYYHTSTGIGLKFTYPTLLPKRTWDFEIPKEFIKQNVHLKDDLKLTVKRESYIWPFSENDPTDRSERVPLKSVHYISKFGERIKADPPIPYEIQKSEYQQNYPYNTVQPITSDCVTMKDIASCQVVKLGNHLRPKLAPESEGYSKFLDPYTTTSQLAHHPFDRNEIQKYNKKQVMTIPQLSPRIKPVYDVLIFRNKYIEKILPKVVKSVPHSGMETEMKGNYRLPIDEMSHYSPKDVVTKCIPPLSGPSKTDIFLTPSMYDTEYNELGKTISICPLPV